ncbi:MAG: hypothetical protein ABF682_02400 [Liquorilactobacillus sp.]|uniref:hypothetical protein n=1 Tax=Liquorilactobacillus sp. TaxID=2767923 RepID=UPI0039E84856
MDDVILGEGILHGTDLVSQAVNRVFLMLKLLRLPPLHFQIIGHQLFGVTLSASQACMIVSARGEYAAFYLGDSLLNDA